MLQPSTAGLMQMINSVEKPEERAPLANARADYVKLFANFGADPVPETEVQWGALSVPASDKITGSVSVGCRYYLPTSATKAPMPVLLYLHGGGWTLGNTEAYHSFCTHICRQSGLAVVSADYRLAPEHACPAAAIDAFTCFSWLASGSAVLPGGVALDGDNIAVSGDSAGGNLTLVVALMARNAGPNLTSKIKLCLPLCPSTNLSVDPADPPAGSSMETYAVEHFLTAESMVYFRGNYTKNDAAISNGMFASPLLVDDVSGLPPTTIVTASHDPLVDEGRDFYKRLLEAGNQAKYLEYAGEIHVFFLLGKVIQGASSCVADLAFMLKAASLPLASSL